MKHLKLIFACLLTAFFSIGQVWAQAPVGTTLFSENFNGYAANDVPDGTESKATGRVVYGGASVAYTCADNGSNKTMIYTANLAGGTSPELLVGKSAGVFTVAGIPSGGAQEITVSFKQNAQKLTVSLGGTGYSTTYTSPKPSSAGTVSFDITVANEADATFSLIMAAGSSNVRVDDILVTVKTAGEGAGTPKCATPSFSPAAGSYEGTQNVTITSTTGATIYYTTDGSTPNTSSSVYSDPIAVSTSQTIKAYATLTSYDDSDVAEAAYTITAGPDVTLNLIDGNWSFPTGDTKTLTEYTNSETGYKVSCYATTAFKVSGSNYFIIGKADSYILLPEFANPIDKIVVVGNSGGSGAVVFNIFDGETAASTAVTGCTSDQTFNITNPKANNQYTLKVTSGHNLQLKAIKIYYGTAPAVAQPTISGAESFVTSTEVTIECETSGAAIYYTTDPEKKDAPSVDTWALYNGASKPSFSATTTIYAAARLSSDWSSVATKTFTKVDALTTIDAIFSAATTAGSTAIDKFVTFNNWVVSAITSNNVFVTDGTKGFIMYANSHGFNVGDVLNGTVACKVQLYKGSAELTNVTSATEGLTVTAGGAATVNTLTIDQLGAINTGAVVKIENVAYDGTNLSDGTNTIKPYNKLFAYSMESGKDYNVTGVIDYYDALQIMPRSAADVEEITAAGAPEAPTFSPAAGTYNEVQNVTISCATDGVTIYYTTDGNVPTTSSSVYSTPIAVSADMTIKAIAVKNDVESAVATATYFINVPLTTMDAIFAKATAVGTTATDVTIILNNWVVSGIYSNNKDVFVTDGSKGFIIYDGGAAMGFNVGDVLSGTVACKVQLYHGAAEVTNLSSSTTGLTVTPDGSAALNTKTIDQLGAINTGALVKIENLTYNSTSKTLSDGVNEITPYKGIFASMAFENGVTYNVTGVVGYYDVLQVMPRSASDIEDATPAPVLTDYYEKVTETAGIVEGTYLIVYEAGNLAFNGGLETLDAVSNTIPVTIVGGNQIAVSETTAAATFYIDPTAGTIKAANGKYIGVTSYNNGLSSGTTGYVHTNMSIDGGNAVLYIQKEEWNSNQNGKMQLCYNPTSGQTRFRYFKEGSQQAIQLYKLANEVVKQDPGISWDPESAELTLSSAITTGDYPEPVLIIQADLGENPLDFITLSSDNESLATINKTNDGQIKISWVPDATGTVHFTASYPGNETYKAVTAKCTVKVNPANSIYVSPSLNVNFGTVAKDATVDDKVITVTLTGVDAASVALAGDGASAFSFTPDALTASGDITISASSATAGTFAATLTISDDAGLAASKVVNLSLTVNDPAAAETPISTSTKWVPATAIADGMQVLITGVKDEVVYAMGEQKSTNRAAYVATVDGEGVLTPGEGTMAFTLVAQDGGTYAIRTSNGKYLYAAKNDANHLKTQDDVDVNAKWTLAVNSAVAEGSSNRNIMRFNGSGDNKLFSCYSSGQTEIKFYVPKPAAPTKDLIRDGLSNGKWGTICPKQTVEDVEGARFYQITSLEEKDGLPYNVIFDEISGTTLTAGQPYFFIAEGAEIRGNKTGAVLDAAGAGVNGFYGYIGTDPKPLSYLATYDAESNNTFVIYNNSVFRINGPTDLKSERCYININATEPSRAAAAPVPGRHRVTVGVSGAEEAQGIDNIGASEKPMKMMINGQLFIIRGEKMYDATGKLVK